MTNLYGVTLTHQDWVSWCKSNRLIENDKQKILKIVWFMKEKMKIKMKLYEKEEIHEIIPREVKKFWTQQDVGWIISDNYAVGIIEDVSSFRVNIQITVCWIIQAACVDSIRSTLSLPWKHHMGGSPQLELRIIKFTDKRINLG